MKSKLFFAASDCGLWCSRVTWCDARLWCVTWRVRGSWGRWWCAQCSLFTRILDSVTSQSPARGHQPSDIQWQVIMTWWWWWPATLCDLHDLMMRLWSLTLHSDILVTPDHAFLWSDTRGWPLIVTSWCLLTNPGWCGLGRLPQRLQAGGPGQPQLGPRPRQDDHRGEAGGADGLPGLVFLPHRWLPYKRLRWVWSGLV